jgi:hypothetical protein
VPVGAQNVEAKLLLVKAHTNVAQGVLPDVRCRDGAVRREVSDGEADLEKHTPFAGVVFDREDRRDYQVLARSNPVKIDERGLRRVRSSKRAIVR